MVRNWYDLWGIYFDSWLTDADGTKSNHKTSAHYSQLVCGIPSCQLWVNIGFQYNGQDRWCFRDTGMATFAGEVTVK